MVMPRSWNERCFIPEGPGASLRRRGGAWHCPAQEFMPAARPGGDGTSVHVRCGRPRSQEVRKDLPCTVTTVKPVLGFDLKFHAGYEVTVPLKELAGSENQLTDGVPRHARRAPGRSGVLLAAHRTCPPSTDDAGGPAYLQGTFDVGEGKYHIDWLMRDRGRASLLRSTGTSKPACPPRTSRWRSTSRPTPCRPPIPSRSGRSPR